LTQTDNATGGLAKVGETIDKQRCWETQRDPHKTRNFEKNRDNTQKIPNDMPLVWTVMN